MTPSPLREAMDGVIEQLDALGMSAGPDAPPAPPAPIDPWSPESFDMVSRGPPRRTGRTPRPHTALGYPPKDEGYETWSGESSQDPSYVNGHKGEDHPPPELSNYVDRMEKQLRHLHNNSPSVIEEDEPEPPPPPPKNGPFDRPKSSIGTAATDMSGPGPTIPERKLRHRKSAYEVGREVLGRTFTTKTNSTNSSSATRSTAQNSDRTLMSNSSAGAISATSANSYARRRERAQSALSMRDLDGIRPDSPFTGVTYHSSHASVPQASATQRPQSQAAFHDDGMAIGGLVQPKAPKRSIFKKIFDSAKTGVASGRSHIGASGESRSPSPVKSRPAALASNMGAAHSSPHLSNTGRRDSARDAGPGNSVDWVQVRRDVNRSNSLSRNERVERRERAQMLDYPAINATDELSESIDGDEGVDGMPVSDSINYQNINFSQVDKNTRFVANLPPTTTAVNLATTYVCRPYRSDAQRLRAIFTYASEKILWEEDFEGEVDTRRVIQSNRGCPKEVAVLVMEMCAAVGVQCEVVRGYLKTPGEIPEASIMPRSNHWWNAVAVDGQWRVMDCSLAAPSNPRRAQYSSVGGSVADPWWFLARPTEVCWTHIPEHHAQQHICPPVAHEILLNLPCACPPFFRNGVEMVDYNSSLTRIEDLEMVHVTFGVPADVEVAAEVEVRAFATDLDGDVFESGDTVRKRALAQAEWFGGVKRYTVKAILPGDEGQGVLRVYAGKRGLMHSIKDVPHPLAFALPVIHTGENPTYDFVTRHPTPHAQRHDIYVAQPQCRRLALNNTFVFAIRQHPSAAGPSAPPPSDAGNASPVPFARPGSAMSMTASNASSNPSSSASGGKKPAKLAIQTPGGKILRLMRKDGKGVGVGGARGIGEEDVSDGGTWETIIKCSERGIWRGLVLADRTARWCVFAEWVCE